MIFRRWEVRYFTDQGKCVSPRKVRFWRQRVAEQVATEINVIFRFSGFPITARVVDRRDT